MSDEAPRPAAWPDPDELVRALTERVLDAVASASSADRAALDAGARAAVAAVLDPVVRETQERLRRAERLAVIGQLSATVAHELRNPLSVIETSAFIVAENARGDERLARHARRITEQVALAGGVIGDLLEAARDRRIAAAPADLAAIARAAVAQVPCPAGASVTLDLPAQLPPVEADERRIRQVVTNLVSNALDAVERRGRVRVAVREREGALVLAVTDDGPGIAAHVLPRLFEPLFTTKAHGTGLGLSLSRAIARAHGGDLTAANDPAGGARFELSLPLAGRGEPGKGA